MTFMTRPSPLSIKPRIYCGDEIAMGPGKADLLEAIDREGSISAAGRAMKMSYRRTWLLVDVMNRCWKTPLVHTAAGGGQGSGARLTPLGIEILAAYRALQAKLAQAATGNPLSSIEKALLESPKPAQD